MKLKANKTIFSNLMRMSIIIIMLCAVLMSTINIFLSDRYSKKEKAVELKTVSSRVNELTAQYTQNYSQDANYLYQFSLDRLAEYIDGTIIITDNSGNIVANSDTDAQLPEKIDISSYGDVLAGSSTYRVSGFNRIMHFNTFSVASPFTYNNTVFGIIFIITKNEILSTQTLSTASMTGFSVAIAIFAAFLTSYFLSDRLIRPLKKIGAAAKEITLGRYNTLDVNTKIIEYNELIHSFNTMSTELKKQDKARSDFIANVSHDLRTPLTNIMGFVGGVMDGTIPKEMQNQYLGVALSEAKRMQNMVNSNLDLSKFESDTMKLNYSSFNLNDIIRSIVISMQDRIKEKKIVIDFKYENAENLVEADESAIYRVIQNLLDNALKFAAKDTEIEMSVKQRGALTYFRIKNYGSSISPEEQKYIWDRYFKADRSRSVDKNGSGLGLFIVKNIINLHNQHITIESDENSVTFEFSLNSDV